MTFFPDIAEPAAASDPVARRLEEIGAAADSDCTKVLFVRACPPVETY
jgi:hypothetical protein